MSASVRIGRPYRASSGTPATYPENASASASGMDRTRVIVFPARPLGDGRVHPGVDSDDRARAIDAGGRRQPPARIETHDVPTEGGVRQQRKTSVVAAGTTPGQGRERANAHDPRGSARSRMTTSTSTTVNGTPMTAAPDKEKARCANTGPLLDKSSVVPVGIRSDRRQTA